MVAVIAADAADACAGMLRAAGEQVYVIGRIAPRGDGDAVAIAS
jgi:phosphoribosylformylglycinamidine cyclo-ligase